MSTLEAQDTTNIEPPKLTKVQHLKSIGLWLLHSLLSWHLFYGF